MLGGKGTWLSCEEVRSQKTLAGQVEEQEFTKDPEQEPRKGVSGSPLAAEGKRRKGDKEAKCH